MKKLWSEKLRAGFPFPRFGPDLDPVRTDFGSESGPHQVKIGSKPGSWEGSGGGPAWRGKPGWDGPVAPSESLQANFALTVGKSRQLLGRHACRTKLPPNNF